MLRHKRYRPLAEINVVPYIDVMLVLLIIFMITAPLLTQGVKVELPNAKAKQIESKHQEPIIVSVDARGNYYLNIAQNAKQIISPEQLYNLVSAELAKGDAKERQVLIKGDRSVDYGKVVQAMVLLQQAGAATVGLVTQPEDAAQISRSQSGS